MGCLCIGYEETCEIEYLIKQVVVKRPGVYKYVTRSFTLTTLDIYSRIPRK